MPVASDVREAIRELIGRTALLLDAEAFEAFLEHCTAEFSYRASVMSPELGREMVWLEQDREALEKLFRALPEHLTRPGRLTRQVNVARIEDQDHGFSVTSTVSIFATDLKGQSTLLAVGRYQDLVVSTAGQLQLMSRELQLDTRDLGIGAHVPL